jgi:hypothetical protein
MSVRSLAIAVATVSLMHIGNANAQSVYVAPGGVYIGGGPVYVIPAPNNGGPAYLAPPYGYGPPAAVAPAPTIAAPTLYGPNEDYYDSPLSTYAAVPPPRPPLAVPNHGSARCSARGGYGQRPCY